MQSVLVAHRCVKCYNELFDQRIGIKNVKYGLQVQKPILSLAIGF